MTPPDLQMVLLAAGSSTRFGSPKLLADVNGQPMLATAIDTLLALDRGARELLKRFGEQVVTVHMPRAAVDVDTPAHLDALRLMRPGSNKLVR